MKFTLFTAPKYVGALFFSVIILFTQNLYAGGGPDYTWNGSTSTDWNTSTNWTPNGTPASGDDIEINNSVSQYPVIEAGVNAVAGKIEITGSGASLTMNGGTLTADGDLKINSSGELIQSGGTASVKGINKIETAGTYTQTDGTLKIGETADGDFKIPAGGVFNSTGGTVEIKGASKKLEIEGTATFFDLIIGGSGRSVSKNSSFNVKGDFTNTGGITGTKILNIVFNGSTEQVFTSGGVVSATTNYTVNSGATLQMADATTVVLGTSFNLQSGATLGIRSTSGITTAGNAAGNIQTTTRTYSTGASYIYNGSADQVVGDGLPATINNLTIANTGALGNETVNLTQASDRIIVGDLTISDGTFWIRNKTVDHAPIAGGTFTIADGATLRINGSGFSDNFPNNYSTVSLGCNSVVNYSGGDQIISPQSYGTVLLDNTGIKRLLTGTTNVCIAFEVNSGITLQMEDANTVITGQQFDLKAGATIGVRSANGLRTTASGNLGHVQTSTRNYDSGANYIYNGSVNQIIGNGPPATVAKLVIENTGSLFNNIVSLTRNISAGELEVNNGVLQIADQVVVEYSTSITNDANIRFVNSAVFGSLGAITGTGTITLYRSFSRSGWQHMSFPLKSSTSKTLGDIVKYGEAFNYSNPKTSETNIFYWDAATAGWLIPTSGTVINKPFNIYSFGSGEGVELTIDNADFNNDTYAQSYIYFANSSGSNTTTPGNADDGFGTDGWADAVVDGWNLFANPFQSYLNSSSLTTSFNADIDQNIYVWNGSGYTVNPTYVSPHQSYFVHTNANSGSFNIQTSVKDNAGAGSGSFFKTNNELVLHLTSENIEAKTVLIENTDASYGYDSNLDAYYLLSSSGDYPTVFCSVGVDSLMYAKNQVPIFTEPIYLTFAHKQNFRPFTLSIETSSTQDFDVVILEDTYNGEFTNLLVADYEFTSTDAAPPQRFKLHFNQNEANKAALMYNDVLKFWVENNQLAFDDKLILDGATLSVFSLGGQLIARGKADEPMYIYQSGLYIVNVLTSNNETYNIKVNL